MSLAFKKMIVLAPHTDDGELGCGGSIARFLEEGKEVYYVAFSTARTSVRPDFPENILETEVRQATKTLGIPSDHLIVYDFQVRRFPQYRQEILEKLITLRNDLQPDLIFIPSLNDIHQDHQVVAREALRAFKKQTVLGYEEPWNNIVFETKCFVPLSEQHMQKKLDALACYKSQQHRTYLNADLMKGLAQTRGSQIEGLYAEAFEVLRLIFPKE